MRPFIFCIVMGIFSSCISQRPIIKISGHDAITGVFAQPQLRVTQTYYDFMDTVIMPPYMLAYYDKLKNKEFANVDIIIDTTIVIDGGYATTSYITTRKAKSGYLSINKKLIEAINSNKGEIHDVTYILAGDTISKANIRKLLFLENEEINETDISVSLNTLVVRIK